MTALQPVSEFHNQPVYASDEKEFVTMKLGDYYFGVSVLAVQDVLRSHKIMQIPLTPPMVAGSLNLRGRIVTAIDLRKRLGMEPFADLSKAMHVVVQYRDELFSLLVDNVGDVMSLSMNQFEKTPSNLQNDWRDMAAGVFKLDGKLLIILDVAGVIGI
jgi:purine-binding chemotaxis protein CheW